MDGRIFYLKILNYQNWDICSFDLQLRSQLYLALMLSCNASNWSYLDNDFFVIFVAIIGFALIIQEFTLIALASDIDSLSDRLHHLLCTAFARHKDGLSVRQRQSPHQKYRSPRPSTSHDIAQGSFDCRIGFSGVRLWES